MNTSVVFTNLKELKCLQMTEQDIIRCPRLRKLTVFFPSLSLQHLPVDTMQELYLTSATVFPAAHQPHEDTNHILLIVPRLTNLKVLRIVDSVTAFEDENSSFKKKLLQNQRKLEVVSVNFDRMVDDEGEEFHEDKFVEQLVQTNPNIREIDNLYLTENGIQSLCSLNHLKEIGRLRVSSPDQVITAVKTVLAGNSHHILQKVEVGLRLFRSSFADVHIISEVDHELQEAGLPFKVKEFSDNYLKVTRF
jgi:hypothetical protein